MRIDEILCKIESMGAGEIDELVEAVMNRKRELYPDWELVYYARRKEEKEDTEHILRLIQNFR